MQRTFVQFFLVIGIMFSLTIGQTFAADVKIGVIDPQEIMKTSKAAKEARGILLMDRESKLSVLRAKEAEIRQMQEDLKSEAAGKDKKAVREKRERLAKEMKEHKRLKEDLEEELKKKDVELTRKLINEIREIVETFRKKKKYTVIFEKKSVVVYDRTVDITDEIIKMYDAKKKK
ncbi:OmpH family outer membrane protein [Thermodesulfobacteriota bacterium]